MALILTGKYVKSVASFNQGTSISGTLRRINSTRDPACGAPSTRPMKEALGSPRAWHTRSSLPRGSCTSRVAGELGLAREAVAISCGRWACRIAGWVERRTKMAEKEGVGEALEEGFGVVGSAGGWSVISLASGVS